MKKVIATSAKKTQKLGGDFAKEILGKAEGKKATILCLSGNLGGGKTTFLQGFAKGLGIKEKILSPTFVILKKFQIPEASIVKSTLSRNFHDRYFYHIDCYRLKDEKDILELGWEDIISDSRNIVAVEWPEKIKKVLAKDAIKVDFKFIDNKTREITFE